MRLLVVTQYFWPENFRINDLVTEMVARGHEVTVLTGIPNYPEGQIDPEFARDPDRFRTFSGAAVFRVPMISRGQGNFRLVMNYLSFVVSGLVLGTWLLRGRNFDAIFVFQTSPITAALPALWLRRLKKAPVLMWILDLWPESISAVGAIRSRRIQGWVGHLVSFIYRRCDRILIQSTAFIPNVETFGGDPERIRYFPNWTEPIFHGSLDEVPVAAELAPYLNTFNVLFAGNIGDAQDFPAILDAAEALKDRTDIRWLILGDGRAADWVRAEIQRRGLEASVIMLGRHPLERMPSFFRGAQALLVSLKKEPIFSMTIPGKVQSYLASGLPLLGMLDGEGARVITEAGAGLVCPAGEGSLLAERVKALASLSETERMEMGEKGRIYCHHHFDRAGLMDDLQGWMSDVMCS